MKDPTAEPQGAADTVRSCPSSEPAEDNHVLALINQAVDLHTLPVVVLEAERLMRDRRTSAQDIAKIIVRDIALAERVLRLANSAYYGFQKRIGNLTQAVVLLGFQTVKNLLLTVSVIENFRPDENDEFHYPAFWGHSVATAIASTAIARKAGLPDAEDAYVAGLLHDVGKLLVAQHLGSLATQVRQLEKDGLPTRDAERQILGYDHSDIGSKLVLSWNLPDQIAVAIRDHHCPTSSHQSGTLSDVIQLGDCIVSALGFRGTSQTLEPVSEGLSERLGYDEKTLADWLSAVDRSLLEARDFFDYLGVCADGGVA